MNDTLPDPLVAPNPPAPAPPSSQAWKIGLAALTAAVIASAGTLALKPPSLLPPASTTAVEVAPTPDVVLAVRSLARLESVTVHVERVVDLAEHDKHLFGLVDARDAILLVAVGDVVAGTDLSELGPADVDADFAAQRVTVHLPPAKVLSTHLDDAATHVFSRSTDVLAVRHTDLEQRARKEALSSMEKAALDSGVLDRAQGGAEKAVRALLLATGFREITFR